MSMTAVIESIERDSLRQAMKPEIEMSLVQRRSHHFRYLNFRNS